MTDCSKLENPPTNETALIEKLRQLLTTGQTATPGAAERRGQHPKSHGCVWATTEIARDLPAELQTSVFQPGAQYQTIVRFSNGRANDDTQKDAHGMAIKLLGVSGPKVLEDDECETQDFVLADSPSFFARDVQHMLDFVVQTAPVAAGGGGKTAAELAATTHPLVATFTKHASPSPFFMTYWSQTPYCAGGKAVKYFASPAVSSPDGPKSEGDANFLRGAMIARLAAGNNPVEFGLFAQMQDDPQLEPVEDASAIWSTTPVKVATISIAPQAFSSTEQMDYCERLVYTPWHANTEHLPLGGINRARRLIYLDSRNLRFQTNHAQPKEPIGSDRERLGF